MIQRKKVISSSVYLIAFLMCILIAVILKVFAVPCDWVLYISPDKFNCVQICVEGKAFENIMSTIV